MKNLNLEAMGLILMNLKEMQTTYGGANLPNSCKKTKPKSQIKAADKSSNNDKN